jgi:hypothetical protein
MIKGGDVASYQTTAYNTKGWAFCFVKCTESTSYINPRYASQMLHSRASGLVTGHYHFVRPGSMSAQFAWFKRNAMVKPGDMIALDWEDSKVSSADKDAWLDLAQAAYPHNRVVLYCNTSFWKSLDKSSKCGDGLWIADPSSPAGKPRIEHSWVFHQYTSAGGQDIEVGNFITRDVLVSWCAKGATAPPMPPTPTAPTKKVTIMTEAQQVDSMYNDLMRIKPLDNDSLHAAGFFLAHAARDAQGAFKAVLALTEKVDALTAIVEKMVAAK